MRKLENILDGFSAGSAIFLLDTLLASYIRPNISYESHQQTFEKLRFDVQVKV